MACTRDISGPSVYREFMLLKEVEKGEWEQGLVSQNIDGFLVMEGLEPVPLPGYLRAHPLREY